MRQTMWLLAGFIAFVLWLGLPSVRSEDLSVLSIDVAQIHRVAGKNLPELVIVNPI
jgi:hypothetical protein